MKRIAMQVFCIAALALCMCGCESDDDDSPTVDVTGTWSGTLTLLGESDTGSITLTQQGSSVTGVDDGGTTWSGNVRGSTLTLRTEVNEDGMLITVELSGPVTDTTMDLTGTIDASEADGSKMSGSAEMHLTKR